MLQDNIKVMILDFFVCDSRLNPIYLFHNGMGELEFLPCITAEHVRAGLRLRRWQSLAVLLGGLRAWTVINSPHIQSVWSTIRLGLTLVRSDA